MANENLFQVGVKALIKNSKGEMLLLKANVSNFQLNTEVYWDIPGGRIQQGNDAEQTLKREIQEEIGVTEIGELRFRTAVISNHEIPISDTQKVGLVLMIYEVAILDGAEITLSDEHTDYEWTDKSEAAERLAHKYPAEFTTLIRGT